MPAASVGFQFRAQLAVAGGAGQSDSWTVSGLPAGLSADDTGLISGTPTATGSSMITVVVSNGASQATGVSPSHRLRRTHRQLRHADLKH